MLITATNHVSGLKLVSQMFQLSVCWAGVKPRNLAGFLELTRCCQSSAALHSNTRVSTLSHIRWISKSRVRGRKTYGEGCEKGHGIAWSGAWMGNIQSCVEGLNMEQMSNPNFHHHHARINIQPQHHTQQVWDVGHPCTGRTAASQQQYNQPLVSVPFQNISLLVVIR